MKVLGIGETVIDKTIVVKRHGNMSRFAHVQEDIGGPVPAGLLLLRKLGVRCEFVTSLGDDAYGQQVKAKFAERGVALHVTPRIATKQHHSANTMRHRLTLTNVERYFTQLQKEAAMY